MAVCIDGSPEPYLQVDEGATALNIRDSILELTYDLANGQQQITSADKATN